MTDSHTSIYYSDFNAIWRPVSSLIMIALGRIANDE